LAGHGSASEESFARVDPQDWITDAAEAIALSRLLGDQIILMSCSTGSTLATYLAAENPNAIAAHILYSPNFDLADSNSKMMTLPWGLQLTRLAFDSHYRTIDLGAEANQFWTTTYRLEGILALRYLVDDTMTEEIWENFDDPYLLCYYYQDEQNHDKVISIEAIEKFHEINQGDYLLNTIKPLAEPGGHVIASPLQSKNIEIVKEVTRDFLKSFFSQAKLENQPGNKDQ
ncbi:MAG: hypothetical protein HKN16_12160, partial [Saprospiraceae bacterium]|nr:hypothetical protein [Saprospiraceae bacterium]